MNTVRKNLRDIVKLSLNHCFCGIRGLLSIFHGESRTFFPSSQCALAADEVVFNEKELEVKELKNQVQMMVQENKGHVLSLKEAQKVNRLQVEFISASSSADLMGLVTNLVE